MAYLDTNITYYEEYQYVRSNYLTLNNTFNTYDYTHPSMNSVSTHTTERR